MSSQTTRTTETTETSDLRDVSPRTNNSQNVRDVADSNTASYNQQQHNQRLAFFEAFVGTLNSESSGSSTSDRTSSRTSSSPGKSITKDNNNEDTAFSSAELVQGDSERQKAIAVTRKNHHRQPHARIVSSGGSVSVSVSSASDSSSHEGQLANRQSGMFVARDVAAWASRQEQRRLEPMMAAMTPAIDKSHRNKDKYKKKGRHSDDEEENESSVSCSCSCSCSCSSSSPSSCSCSYCNRSLHHDGTLIASYSSASQSTCSICGGGEKRTSLLGESEERQFSSTTGYSAPLVLLKLRHQRLGDEPSSGFATFFGNAAQNEEDGQQETVARTVDKKQTVERHTSLPSFGHLLPERSGKTKSAATSPLTRHPPSGLPLMPPGTSSSSSPSPPPTSHSFPPLQPATGTPSNSNSVERSCSTFFAIFSSAATQTPTHEEEGELWAAKGQGVVDRATYDLQRQQTERLEHALFELRQSTQATIENVARESEDAIFTNAFDCVIFRAEEHERMCIAAAFESSLHAILDMKRLIVDPFLASARTAVANAHSVEGALRTSQEVTVRAMEGMAYAMRNQGECSIFLRHEHENRAVIHREAEWELQEVKGKEKDESVLVLIRQLQDEAVQLRAETRDAVAAKRRAEEQTQQHEQDCARKVATLQHKLLKALSLSAADYAGRAPAMEPAAELTKTQQREEEEEEAKSENVGVRIPGSSDPSRVAVKKLQPDDVPVHVRFARAHAEAYQLVKAREGVA